MKLFKKDNSIEMSLSEEKIVHGVKVWKFPNQKFISLLKILQNIPKDLFQEIYPDKTLEEAIDALGDISFDGILKIINQLLIFAPEKICSILAEILEVDEDVIRNKLSPLETLEILQELGKLNNFDELKKKLMPLLSKVPVVNQMMKILMTGYKESSFGVSPTVSAKKNSLMTITPMKP